MCVGERLDDRILDEVLGIGLLMVPTASRAPQERDFVFNAAPEVWVSRAGVWSRLMLAYETLACKNWIGLGRVKPRPAIRIREPRFVEQVARAASKYLSGCHDMFTLPIFDP